MYALQKNDLGENDRDIYWLKLLVERYEATTHGKLFSGVDTRSLAAIDYSARFVQHIGDIIQRLESDAEKPDAPEGVPTNAQQSYQAESLLIASKNKKNLLGRDGNIPTGKDKSWKFLVWAVVSISLLFVSYLKIRQKKAQN